MLRYYLQAVDWPSRLAREIPFISGQMVSRGARRVLDCGCGIGRHVAALAAMGFLAEGVDSNPGHVEEARQAASGQPRAVFHEGDITDLQCLNEGTMDALLCLGNTLSALEGSSLTLALSAFRRVLKRGGFLLVHVLNGESMGDKPRVDVRGVESEAEDIVFIKTLHPEGEFVRLTLHVVGKPKGGGADAWSGDLESARLRRLTGTSLRGVLEGVGFHDVNVFGSLSGKEFQPSESADLVCTATS